MVWLFIALALLALNLLFSVGDVKRGNTTKSAAFSWFVIGWLTFDILNQLTKLL